MSARCGIGGCTDAAELPARVTFKSTHVWPHAEAEFVRVLSHRESSGDRGGDRHGNPRARTRSRAEVVDTYACRQMFLRSYTFSRKESVPEKTRRCLDKVKDRMIICGKREGNEEKRKTRRKKKKMKKKKKKCSGSLIMQKIGNGINALFQRLLSCTSSVDVTDRSGR